MGWAKVPFRWAALRFHGRVSVVVLLSPTATRALHAHESRSNESSTKCRVHVMWCNAPFKAETTASAAGHKVGQH